MNFVFKGQNAQAFLKSKSYECVVKFKKAQALISKLKLI